MKPNTITLDPDEELAEILSRCRFVPRVGTRCFGPRFAVELSSRSHLRDRIGNLHLRIVPLVPLASTDEAFLEMAGDAHRDMIDHANPGIVAFARRELDRLTGDRLPTGALEHRRIVLLQGDTSYTATTDEDGEADFTGVELDKECSLLLGAVQASPEDELTSLISQLRFSDRNGTTLTGRFWQVAVQVNQSFPSRDYFEAAVTIQALTTEAEELLPCELRLLRNSDGPSPMWVLSPGPTNAQGEARFSCLPRGIYEAYLEGTAADLQLETRNPADLAKAAPALAHCAPAIAHFAPTDSDDFAPLRLRLPDRPIEVVLSRASDGRAMLTFETSDPTLAGSGHTWSLGGESGWFELERAGDRWIAEARLDMSSSDARAIIHRLVVRSEDQAETDSPADSQPANVIPVNFRLGRSHSEAEFASRFPMAAAASPAEAPVVPEKVRKLPLTDPESGLSIEALLQPAPDEKTTLIVRSEDRALAGAGVAYSVGPSSGTMRFGPKRDECYYLARTTLPLPWSEAQTAPVDLEILLKPETSTPE